MVAERQPENSRPWKACSAPGRARRCPSAAFTAVYLLLAAVVVVLLRREFLARLFAQVLFAYPAATYLTVDTEGQSALQEDFRRRALGAGLTLAPVAALVFALARDGAPVIYRGLTGGWGLAVVAGAVVCAAGALAALAARRFRWARAAAIGQVSLVLVGWGLAQYPYLVVPDLTVAGARTAGTTLRLPLWALAAGALLLFPSFTYLYRVFKRRDAPPADG